MKIEIVVFLVGSLALSTCVSAGALNLYLRAFPDHILATQNEAFEMNCIGGVEDLFHPKWVFTRDQLEQANLQDCKSQCHQNTLFEIFIFCPKIQLYFPEKIVDFFGVKNL